MFSPSHWIQKEKEALRKGWKELIMPFLLLLAIILMLLFGTRDVTASQSSRSMTFDPSLPPSEFVVPWRIERLTFKGSEYQNEVVNYAYAKSGSLDFVHTLVAENGTLDPLRRSECVQRDGNREPSYGICQLHMAWHKPFITSPEFKDWRKQVDYCLKVFEKRPGAFYGYYKRARALKSFI